MPDRNIHPGAMHAAIRFGNAGFGALAISVGLTLLLQDRARMSTPGWEVALSIPGLGPRFWGAYMAVGGLLMLTALLLKGRGRQLVAIGSTAVAFALWGRAIAAFYALDDPAASGSAPQFFTALAVLYLANGAIHYRTFST